MNITQWAGCSGAVWSVVSVMAVSVWRRCKVSVIQRKMENGKYFPFSRKIFRLFCRCGAAPHHRQWSSEGLLACFWIIWPSRGLECRGNDTHILRPGEAAEAATMTSAICRAVLLSKQGRWYSIVRYLLSPTGDPIHVVIVLCNQYHYIHCSSTRNICHIFATCQLCIWISSGALQCTSGELINIVNICRSYTHTLLTLCWPSAGPHCVHCTEEEELCWLLMLRNEMEMTSAEQQTACTESRCWAWPQWGAGTGWLLVVQTCKHYLVTVLHLTIIVTSAADDPSVSQSVFTRRRNYHKGRAAIRPLWLLCHRPKFTSTYRGVNACLA